MLTPVDIANRVFKGGIGYDKKDVEAFMIELSTDYRELYSSNVELNDKIATLNESLQHYRSIEDSMQKALTLSEKTAEETVGAANDRARQISTEAEIKAETMLADAKAELQQTKDEIYRLQKQYELFKSQFTKLMDAHKKVMDGEMPYIDLGPDFQPSSPEYGSFSGGSLGNEGGFGGGLGAGTYTGSNDSGRERTNQEPAFDRGALNMDPFADAANGGGRFSRQTGGAYTGAKKGQASQTNTSSSGLNMKGSAPKSNKIKRNVTPAATETTKEVPNPTPMSSKEQVEPVAQNINEQPKASSEQPTKQATQTVSREDVIAAIKAAAEAAEYENYVDTPADANDNVVNGEVENNVNESNMLDSEDNHSEGFDFVSEDTSAQFSFDTKTNLDNDDTYNGEVESKVNESNMLDSEDNHSEGFDFVSDDTSSQFSFDTNVDDDDTYSGEVESKVNESNMLDSEDNYSTGFDFVVNEETEEEIPTILSGVNLNSFNSSSNNDVLSGDVEDKVNQSNLIGNDDDNSEGFSFM